MLTATEILLFFWTHNNNVVPDVRKKNTMVLNQLCTISDVASDVKIDDSFVASFAS